MCGSSTFREIWKAGATLSLWAFQKENSEKKGERERAATPASQPRAQNTWTEHSSWLNTKMNEILEEIEVLKSIFVDDFLTNAPSQQEKKGKQGTATSFSIKVQKEYCSVTLSFTLPKGYPAKSTAQFSVSASHNLSNASLAEINEKLRDAKKRLIGQVQCFELCNVAREHLELYNKKPESLYESMIKREVREHSALDQLRTSQLPQSSINQLDTAADKQRTESFGGSSYNSVEDKRCDPDDKADEDDDEWQQMDVDIPEELKQQVAKLEIFKQKEKAKLQQAATLQQDDDDGDSSEDGYALPDPMTGKGDVEGNVKRGRYASEFEELTLLGKGASGEPPLIHSPMHFPSAIE